MFDETLKKYSFFKVFNVNTKVKMQCLFTCQSPFCPAERMAEVAPSPKMIFPKISDLSRLKRSGCQYECVGLCKMRGDWLLHGSRARFAVKRLRNNVEKCNNYVAKFEYTWIWKLTCVCWCELSRPQYRSLGRLRQAQLQQRPGPQWGQRKIRSTQCCLHKVCVWCSWGQGHQQQPDLVQAYEFRSWDK